MSLTNEELINRSISTVNNIKRNVNEMLKEKAETPEEHTAATEVLECYAVGFRKMAEARAGSRELSDNMKEIIDRAYMHLCRIVEPNR